MSKILKIKFYSWRRNNGIFKDLGRSCKNIKDPYRSLPCKHSWLEDLWEYFLLGIRSILMAKDSHQGYVHYMNYKINKNIQNTNLVWRWSNTFYLWPSTGKQSLRWTHAHGMVATRSHDSDTTRFSCVYSYNAKARTMDRVVTCLWPLFARC